MGGLRADENTGCPIFVTYEHHEIHAGSHYSLVNHDSRGLNAVTEIVITTPAGNKHAHMTLEVSGSTDGIQYDFYEGATGVVGGSAQTPHNNNRNSSKTSILTVVKDPTSISADGTLLQSQRRGANNTVGFSSRADEIMLKSDETYVLRITSLGASNYVNYALDWYEHTVKGSGAY